MTVKPGKDALWRWVRITPSKTRRRLRELLAVIDHKNRLGRI